MKTDEEFIPEETVGEGVMPDAASAIFSFTPAPEPAPEAEVTAPAPAAVHMVDPRRRLRELMSVPERDRSEAHWDEIVELEIQLAPGNRVSGAAPGTGYAPRVPGAGSGNAKKPYFKGPGARMKRNNRPPGNKPPVVG